MTGSIDSPLSLPMTMSTSPFVFMHNGLITRATLTVIQPQQYFSSPMLLLNSHYSIVPSRNIVLRGSWVLFLFKNCTHFHTKPHLANMNGMSIEYSATYFIHSSEFHLDIYDNKDNKIFIFPPPIYQLPTGDDYITQQFILGIEHLEEASYEGNASVIAAILHQLNLDTEEEMKKTGLDHVVVWIGDQLTSAWLQGLFNFHAQDFNSFERLDWLVPTFGWFHLLMAFANSLHMQYLGTTAGYGLMHAFTLLERRGLTLVQTCGPFHQNLYDAICHVTEAHFHACQKAIEDVENLEAL